MKKLVALTFAGLFGLFGCGEDTDTLTPAQATQALTATQTAMSSVDSQLVEVSANGDQVTATVSCTGAGRASVQGTTNGESSFSVSVSFDGCTENQTTINGNLNYNGSFSESAISFSMDGILTYSGAVEGRCRIAIDLQIGDDNISMSGEVCGQDVESLTGV